MNELPEIFAYFERTGYRVYPTDRHTNKKKVLGYRVPIKIAADKILNYLEAFEGCKFLPYLLRFVIQTKKPGQPTETDFCDHCLNKF